MCILAAVLAVVLAGLAGCGHSKTHARLIRDFNRDWVFRLGDTPAARERDFDDSEWRRLDLPHDWSIEGDFSPDHPATPGGGALPGGVGWYRKTFRMPSSQKGKRTFIEFDGVYRNSEVWINGRFLGRRPNGYISFRYDLSPHLFYGEEDNVLAVRVDNSHQPNSRWYTGSGIYRHVRLVTADPVHVDLWGVTTTTPEVDSSAATVRVETALRNTLDSTVSVILTTEIIGPENRIEAIELDEIAVPGDTHIVIRQDMQVVHPELWSVHRPALYRAVTTVERNGRVRDDVETVFGIRTFRFDPEKGFFLNGEPLKILGVCNHHDLGCLGAAVNTRALERRLEILKAMGCNSIRTAHNPPAPELLDLCDRMGFLVMDEMFDMWKKKKSPHDYAMTWDRWHERDLRDFIRRDRNHPSVILWSIGNEILEQWDDSGEAMTRGLAAVVHEMDPTRPVTAGCNETGPHNALIRSGALDVIGFNYHHEDYASFPKTFPGIPLIASETNSALATRGHYDMPSDSVRIWPVQWDLEFTGGNPDNTCSAYDNCRTPWGSTHEATWNVVRAHEHISGMYIWTGFDYLGEPTPYTWPSRSSYFGVIDLAGLPKDAYFFYQSEWTDDPMLHVFPHWNWEEGGTVDVWAYTNCDEVELFLNEESLGVQNKTDDRRHLMWRLPYRPGTLHAEARTGGKTVRTRDIRTAGAPTRIVLEPDRTAIQADGRDLCFVTVRIEDADGNLCPHADNTVRFHVEGPGVLRATDNGLQTSHASFQSPERNAFHGLCLAVVQSDVQSGTLRLTASAENLEGAEIHIRSK